MSQQKLQEWKNYWKGQQRVINQRLAQQQGEGEGQDERKGEEEGKKNVLDPLPKGWEACLPTLLKINSLCLETQTTTCDDPELTPSDPNPKSILKKPIEKKKLIEKNEPVQKTVDIDVNDKSVKKEVKANCNSEKKKWILLSSITEKEKIEKKSQQRIRRSENLYYYQKGGGS